MRTESLPKGLLEMHGEGFSGNSSLIDVAVTTANMNKRGELEERFFGEQNPNTLLQVKLKNGSDIRVHRPTGAYTPYTLLIIAHGPDFEQKPHDQTINTENIYNYPDDTQKAYWSVLLKSLKGYRESLGAEYRVFSGGNWMNNFSNFEYRTPRTIGLPHDHICAVKKEYMKSLDGVRLEEIDGYSQEIEMTNKLLPTAIARVQRALPDDNSIQLSPRTELPSGYSFKISGDTPVDEFARQMRTHHKAYTGVARELGERYKSIGADIIDQPSYNLYIELDENGDRHVSISPTFASASGVLESAGIQSRRSKKVKPLVSPGVVYDTQAQIISNIVSALPYPRIHSNLPHASVLVAK